ncbi:MAG: spore cortex biosynthesis protein YabQ [Lachnospiraceae bacterium]
MIAVSEDIHQEILFLLISLALGEGLVVFYDVFRIFRRIVPHGVIWISVEDILYWIVCALLVFGMIFQTNDGLVRGFSIGGICIGMLFYNHFVSPFFVKHISSILGKIIRFWKKGLKKAGKAVRIKISKP